MTIEPRTPAERVANYNRQIEKLERKLKLLVRARLRAKRTLWWENKRAADPEWVSNHGREMRESKRDMPEMSSKQRKIYQKLRHRHGFEKIEALAEALR